MKPSTFSFAATVALLVAVLAGGLGIPSAATEAGDYGPAPEFAGIGAWINSAPLTMASLRGKVVLVDFWTWSCANCVRSLPHVRDWHERYSADGLVVIGVHTPESDFEKDRADLESAIARYGIRHAVAQDNDWATWKAWGNHYWPAVYLVDRRGHIVLRHMGEGGYEEIDAAIRRELGR
ncbi:MAG TPA: redoxin domain-containing protein [Candidatus Binatia bacterium]|jgi:thiol-disulfide isomerase/thioredoxin